MAAGNLIRDDNNVDLDVNRRYNHDAQTNEPSQREEMDASMAAAPQVRLVSVDMAARPMGIGRTTVYDLVNRGVLRSMKIGRRTLLSVEDINAFVDRKLASA